MRSNMFPTLISDVSLTMDGEEDVLTARELVNLQRNTAKPLGVDVPGDMQLRKKLEWSNCPWEKQEVWSISAPPYSCCKGLPTSFSTFLSLIWNDFFHLFRNLFPFWKKSIKCQSLLLLQIQ